MNNTETNKTTADDARGAAINAITQQFLREGESGSFRNALVGMWDAALADDAEQPADNNGHQWFDYQGRICCKSCGLVKRADGTSNPCKGPVKISLREQPAVEAVKLINELPDGDVFTNGIDLDPLAVHPSGVTVAQLKALTAALEASQQREREYEDALSTATVVIGNHRLERIPHTEQWMDVNSRKWQTPCNSFLEAFALIKEPSL